jgi:hypothetical protein
VTIHVNGKAGETGCAGERKQPEICSLVKKMYKALKIIESIALMA